MKYSCAFTLAALATIAVLTNAAPQGGPPNGPARGPPGGGGNAGAGMGGQAGFGWSAGASGQAGADASSSTGTKSLVKRSAFEQSPPDQRPPRPSNSFQSDA